MQSCEPINRLPPVLTAGVDCWADHFPPDTAPSGPGQSPSSGAGISGAAVRPILRPACGRWMRCAGGVCAALLPRVFTCVGHFFCSFAGGAGLLIWHTKRPPWLASWRASQQLGRRYAPSGTRSLAATCSEQPAALNTPDTWPNIDYTVLYNSPLFIPTIHSSDDSFKCNLTPRLLGLAVTAGVPCLHSCCPACPTNVVEHRHPYKCSSPAINVPNPAIQ